MTNDTRTTSLKYPTEIAMGTGTGPECIAVGDGPFAYMSSLKTGEIFRVDFENGTYEVFHESLGPTTVGVSLDAYGRLFVCGGIDGSFSVIDTKTRQVIKRYQLGGEHTFINDLVHTPRFAYITDSFSPVLYKFPLGPYGELPSEEEIIRLPLTGDFQYRYGEAFSDNFNSNGISFTPDKSAVLVVQTNTGKLFRVDTETGATTLVDLAGATVPGGDGLVLEGNTLYVVQNLPNLVSVIDLSDDGQNGTVRERWTDERFDTPTAMARFGNRFYFSNARFTTPDPQTADFQLIAVER